MEDWKLEPARDLGLSPLERARSLKREGGLVDSLLRLAGWSAIRAMLYFVNRLQVHGRHHLPPQPSFVLTANHASHLDALVLGASIDLRWRDQLYPIAAGDIFFERRSLATLVTTMLNVLPIWRRKAGAHGVLGLRQRLLEQPSIYILFPEGKRTRDGRMMPFKSGIGMLVAGTSVPVVPCYLQGTFEAFPPGSVLPRFARITLRIGAPLVFPSTANDHDGWREVGARVEEAVHQLMPSGSCGLAQPRTS
jgi:1-acyl-sn-glycerol-3-phosphate acyltransferase